MKLNFKLINIEIKVKYMFKLQKKKKTLEQVTNNDNNKYLKNTNLSQ